MLTNVKPDIIVYRGNRYAMIPDIKKLHNGDLVVVFREGSGHISLDGKIFMVRSKDEGKTWSDPSVVFEGYYCDHNPAISELSDGVLIVNFNQETWGVAGGVRWAGHYSLWQRNARYRRATRGSLGTYTVRSFDSGETWESEPARLNSRFIDRSIDIDTASKRSL